MQIDPVLSVISLAVLIMSVVIHEVSHGYTARKLGDHTAEYEGRLTLNPLKHLDIFGSFILPVLLYMVTKGGIIFGWAKPVPYNPYNLRDQKSGELKVALAGPASNFLIAIIFGLGIRLLSGVPAVPELLLVFFAIIVHTNIVLGIFNLIPVPPLDGSKVLYWFVPYRYYHLRQNFEQFGFLLVLAFSFYLWDYISPVIGSVFTLITGLSLS